MSTVFIALGIAYLWSLLAFGIEWAIAIMIFQLMLNDITPTPIRYIAARFVFNLLLWPISVIYYLIKFVRFITKENKI